MNIRNIKTYILSAILTLAFSSCLDKYPEDKIRMDEAINTVDDIDKLVIGIYDSFKSSALYSGNLTILPDLQTDFVYCVKGNSNSYGDIYRWNDIKSTNTDIEAVYADLYDVINRCNYLFDNVDKVKMNTTSDTQLDKLDQCCGEAYLARAIAYSELIKMFCKAYDSDEQAEQELGVVLTEHYKGNESQKRASLKASYDFVLSDLDKAQELLKLDEDFSGSLYNEIYFNEYVCYALRARVSLYMHRYDDAIKYATKVIKSKYYTLEKASSNTYSNRVNDYAYIWQYGDSRECIWKVGFTVNSYGGHSEPSSTNTTSCLIVQTMYQRLGSSTHLITMTSVPQPSSRLVSQVMSMDCSGLCLPSTSVMQPSVLAISTTYTSQWCSVSQSST